MKALQWVFAALVAAGAVLVEIGVEDIIEERRQKREREDCSPPPTGLRLVRDPPE
jgi:hypothetical protein